MTEILLKRNYSEDKNREDMTGLLVGKRLYLFFMPYVASYEKDRKN